jgi:hypothetical protein
VNFHDETPRTWNITEQLIRLAPKKRLIAGIVCMTASSGIAVALWEYGVVWGLTIFFFFMGILLSISGGFGLLRERRHRARVSDIMDKKEEFLAAMIDAKRQGRNPIRFLNEKGIHDAEIRTALIEEMNQRLRS